MVDDPMRGQLLNPHLFKGLVQLQLHMQIRAADICCHMRATTEAAAAAAAAVADAAFATAAS